MIHATPIEIARLLNGTPLIVILDIDGTLCEIVERAGDAHVPEIAREMLNGLNGGVRARVSVAFVTGRSVADAEQMLGVRDAVVYGNHGIERSHRARFGAESQVTDVSATSEASATLRELIRSFPGTTLEDKRFTLTVHYRGMNPELLQDLQDAVRRVADRYALRVAGGKCVFNLVPNDGATKGDAVLEIVDRFGGMSDRASILFAGDDTTDEDGFLALLPFPRAITVRIGRDDSPSAAKYSMDGPDDVHTLLTLITELR
jgi:trehalose-phosphatase